MELASIVVYEMIKSEDCDEPVDDELRRVSAYNYKDRLQV